MGSGFEGIKFYLDGDVTYKGERKFNYIRFIMLNYNNHSLNSYDYESYQIGDLEINLSETVNYKASYGFNGDVVEISNIVRKVGSSSVVSSSSSQQLTSNQIQERDERMRRWVEESGGEYEVDFTARQEQREDGSISARELKWTYRKKY